MNQICTVEKHLKKWSTKSHSDFEKISQVDPHCSNFNEPKFILYRFHFFGHSDVSSKSSQGFTQQGINPQEILQLLQWLISKYTTTTLLHRNWNIHFFFLEGSFKLSDSSFSSPSVSILGSFSRALWVDNSLLVMLSAAVNLSIKIRYTIFNVYN